MQDGAISQTLWMRQLLNVTQSFWEQDRSIYYYSGQDNQTKVGGYYKTESNFTFIAVPKSGHFFPHDNYYASKAILDDMINHKELTCTEESCRVNDFMCEQMNNCSGHGVCQSNGQCQCDLWYKGGDCSYLAFTNWETGSNATSTNGTEWVYYVHDDRITSPRWSLNISLESNDTFDVFVSFDLDASPNQFHNDAVLKNRNRIVLNENTFGEQALVLAIKVNGFDNGQNEAHYNTLTFDYSEMSEKKPWK